MTRILALDLGTACGWALVSGVTEAASWTEGSVPVEIIKYGTFDLRAGRFSGGGMRFVRFENELDNFKGLVDQVVFEEVRRHRGTDAAHVYGGLLAVLTAWCEKNKIPYEGHTVQAIKKAATGRGNASKDEMVAAAKALGFAPETEDEADAIHLLRLAIGEKTSKPK